MRYHIPPSMARQPGLSQNWAMDTRRHAINQLGRTQGLELSEADRRREAIFRVMDAYAMMKQRKKAEEAAEGGGFFGSGGGTATGTLIGTGIGAVVGGPPGAMIGGMIGGGAGGVADVAMAPGSSGAAAGAQQATSLPRNLMAYDQYYGPDAQAGRTARTELLEAQTGYYNRRSPEPQNWPERNVIDMMIEDYLKGENTGVRKTTAQQEKALPGRIDYTNLGLR